MAEALREAYADLFVIKDPPTEKDKDIIEGKFRSAHNAGNRAAELMTRTFLALAKLADFSQKPKEPEVSEEPSLEDHAEEEIFPKVDDRKKIISSLNYNIQIHLPATKDVEVYNAIFKSLKEHLIE